MENENQQIATSSLLTQLGVMSMVSTGNRSFDVVMVAILPVILSKILPYLKEFWEWLLRVLNAHPDRTYSREIETVQRDRWWYDPDGAHNNKLQKAILLYIGSLPKMKHKIKQGMISLEHVEQSDSSSCDSSETSDESRNETVEDLDRSVVNTEPAWDAWLDVEPGLRFQRVTSNEERDQGRIRERRVQFFLESNRANGVEIIDDFIDRALEHYKGVMSGRKDTSRYLYTPAIFSSAAASDDSDKSSGVIFKRYELSDEKTFASLFHPEKEALMHLLEHFVNKTGKFAIPGYPHKLGLLLHGPPGTGKTSLIKALAQHTGRHIISVPLAKIKTNQELMDIVFDQRLKVPDESDPIKMPFSKTIFVFEDIDAASGVVQSRAKAGQEPRLRMPAASPAAAFLTDEAAAICSSSGSSDLAEGGAVPQRVEGPATATGLGALDWSLVRSADQLNLAGLLNVIDGAVDCPNRILVMTTNHPEKLDPALIRPGRINKRVFMGPLAVEEARQMVAHYFQPEAHEEEAREAQLGAFARAFPEGRMTPAQLEMLCAEHDALQGLVEHLCRVGPAAAAEWDTVCQHRPQSA